MFMTVGFLSAALCGLGLPSFVFLFGDIADSFEGNDPAEKILEQITRISKILTIIGLGVWIFSYLFFTCLIISSERIGQKVRIRYLESILKQDIAWFDSINTAELSSTLGKEC
jgi:ATP-binding cassette subfamily B (MDR/TAP) protein 1